MAKAQAAMEFVMTYGWMLIILIVVLALLMYLGYIVPPHSPACSFPVSLICKSWKLTADSNLTLDLYQNTGHDIIVSGINCTKNPSNNPSLNVLNVIIKNEDHNLVADGVNTQCLDVYGNNATGRIGAYYVGKLIIYYTENDTGMAHLVIGDISAPYE